MSYSGLYACSGCSVTFGDPSAWRHGEPEALAGTEPGAPDVDPPMSPHAPPTGGPSLDTWGGALDMPETAGGYGRSEADMKEIREAAKRANKGKAKGLRH